MKPAKGAMNGLVQMVDKLRMKEYISTGTTNMKRRGNNGIASHFALISGITALVVLCILYPFLPGEYDGYVVALSTMAQVFGAFGLLPALIGVLWFVCEVRKRARL